MNRQSSELASIERSKHRYIKLEKWNTVIQQRKSRKLKLQHLKKNLTKKWAVKEQIYCKLLTTLFLIIHLLFSSK